MVVKSSRSTPLINQNRSKEEPLRVTVHYHNLSGPCGNPYVRDSLLASSGSAGRWGATNQHIGHRQVAGSLISHTGGGAVVRPGGRRVRFDLPGGGPGAGPGGPGDEGGGPAAGPHEGLAHHNHHHHAGPHEGLPHHNNHHAEPHRGTRATGWSPWTGNTSTGTGRQSHSQHQSASMRQPGQQQPRWSSAGPGAPGPSPAGPSPGLPMRHGLGHPQGSSSAAVLSAARDGDHQTLLELLRRNPPPSTLNHRDVQGRTAASHLAALGGSGAGASMLELLLQCPGVDVNLADSEGNTPLHFGAQAGQLEAVNVLLRQPDVQVDARNAQGFTPLMKAALQGRTKIARALLLAGASPTLRDTGRGLRAEQWARFCGRHVCAELIERLSRQRLLDRGTAYGRWGSEPELQAALGRVQQARTATTTAPRSIKSRVRRAFRSSTSSSTSTPGLGVAPAAFSASSASPASPPAFSLVTQLTGAGLCASTPALPVPAMPPVVKSLLRPLSVPRLQVTLVGDTPPPLPPRDAALRAPPPPPPPVRFGALGGVRAK